MAIAASAASARAHSSSSSVKALSRLCQKTSTPRTCSPIEIGATSAEFTSSGSRKSRRILGPPRIGAWPPSWRTVRSAASTCSRSYGAVATRSPRSRRYSAGSTGS